MNLPARAGRCFGKSGPVFLQLWLIWQGTRSFCMTSACNKKKILLMGSFIWAPEKEKRLMGDRTVETGLSPNVSFPAFMQHLERCVGKVNMHVFILLHAHRILAIKIDQINLVVINFFLLSIVFISTLKCRSSEKCQLSINFYLHDLAHSSPQNQ